jgi:hypothetical protein
MSYNVPTLSQAGRRFPRPPLASLYLHLARRADAPSRPSLALFLLLLGTRSPSNPRHHNGGGTTDFNIHAEAYPSLAYLDTLIWPRDSQRLNLETPPDPSG